MFGLVEKAKKGSVKDFMQLYQAHEAMLYRISYMFAGERKAALEAMQESACRSFAEMDQLKETGNFKEWLIRMTIRSAQAGVTAALPTETKAEVARGDSPLIESIIHGMTTEEKTALILFSYLGYNRKDAAYFMDLTESDLAVLYEKTLIKLGIQPGVAEDGGREIKQEIHQIEIPHNLHQRIASALGHTAKNRGWGQKAFGKAALLRENVILFACFAILVTSLYVGFVVVDDIITIEGEESNYIGAVTLLMEYMEYPEYEVTDITHTITGDTVNLFVYTSFGSDEMAKGEYLENVVHRFLEVDEVEQMSDMDYTVIVYSSDKVMIN